MSGSTAYAGRAAALSNSANGGSTFLVVGGVRTSSVTLNNNPVDITNVGSGGFQEMLANGGNQALSISLDGVVLDNTPFETMLTQAKDRTIIRYRLAFASGGVIEAPFVIASVAITGAHNDAQTFSATLESSGTIIFTVPT